jgi:hypothetical protein
VTTEPVDLSAKLRRWVEAGLIEPEQAEAIEAHEREHSPPPRRISLVTEALGYVGAVLALAGLSVALANVWVDLTPLTRSMVLFVAAAVFLVAGWPMRGSQEPALARLSSVLWFLSTGALAWALLVLALDELDLDDAEASALMGAGTALYALTLWRIQRRSLQQVALLFGGAQALLSGIAVTGDDVDGWVFGLVLWLAGLAWVSLARVEVMVPADTAFVLGGFLMLVGPGIGAGDFDWLFILAFVTAGGLMIASVALERTSLLALGTVGMFVYLIWAVVKYFGDSLGVPLALTLAGVLVLAVAIVAGRLRTGISPDSR